MTPLLTSTLAYAFGLLFGLRLPLRWPAILAAVLSAAVIFVIRRKARGITLFLAIGAALGVLRATQLGADCRARLEENTRVTLLGVPLALPVDGPTVMLRAVALSPERAAPCHNVIVRVHVSQPDRARVRAAALGTEPGLLISGRWVVYPRRTGWPQRAEHAGALLADTLAAAAGVTAGPLARFRARRQAALREVVPRRWPLAEALLLAQRSGLSSDTRTTWVAAGLVHLLAISGMHVGLIAAGVLTLGALLGLPHRRARRVALLVTAAYVMFLGAPHAALRALLQAALLLGALELQRPAEPFTLVAAAAFVILCIDPLAVLEPGFQLSFAGIIGLVAWRRPLLALLPARLPGFLREGLAAGVAASALTTPIAALQFGQAAWIGIVASIVATPVLGVAIAALVCALLAHALLGGVPASLSYVVEAPLHALAAIADTAARVPGGHTFLAPATVLIALCAVILTIVVRRVLTERAALAPTSHAPAAQHERHAGRGRRARFRLAVAGAAGLVVVAWAPMLLRTAGEHVEIHAIDVGQGDSFAVRTPRGRWFLIDAGPRTPRSDAGRERVAPYLQRLGVHRIEAIILTHPDADHIGGAAAVLDAFDVGMVVDPGLPAGKDMYIDLLAAARSERHRWIAARAGMAFRVDGVEFEFLYPPRSLDALRDANDNSVVFRLAFGSFAALFLGDAPAAVEQELVTRHGARLRVAVLKVGHHGSATSTSEDLLTAARPTLALVSAGQRNRYGHPAPSVLRRLAEHDVRVLRTDQLGNVTLRARRDGYVDAHSRR